MRLCVLRLVDGHQGADAVAIYPMTAIEIEGFESRAIVGKCPARIVRDCVDTLGLQAN